MVGTRARGTQRLVGTTGLEWLSGTISSSDPACTGIPESQGGRDLSRCAVGEVLTQDQRPRVIPARGEGGRRSSSLPPASCTSPQNLSSHPSAPCCRDVYISRVRHNQGPQTEWLKQQKRIVSPFWRLKSEIEVLAGPVPSEGMRGGSVPGLSPSPCR